MTVPEEPLTAELFVRSLSPTGAARSQDAVLADLDRLVAGGTLAEYDLYVWGDAVDPTARAATTRYGELVVERVARFREWADACDATLVGGFEMRTRESALTGESRDVVELPILTLAEYRGGDLRCVAPVEADGTVYTVRDRLGALAVDGDDADGLDGPAGTGTEPEGPVVKP